jgi:hypothetical protein
MFAVTGSSTAVIVAAIRLLFRRGKGATDYLKQAGPR